MPSKRIFDLVLVTTLLAAPAVGLGRMAARRWAREGNGAMSRIGASLVVSL